MYENLDRETLLGALSIVDLLETGWQPGDRELETARYVQDWVILPSNDGLPYRMRGVMWSLPVKCTFMEAGVIALDRTSRWARFWDEWVVIGNPIDERFAVDGDKLRRASAAWLMKEMRNLPAPA